MALKAIALRLPEDLVVKAKEASARAGTSFTAYVKAALETRLEAPSLAQMPMQPLPATDDVAVPRETERKVTYSVDPRVCAHPWRNGFGVCTSCGNQR